MPSVDDLAHELRPADGDPAGAIVLLHGRGTSERDLLPLLDVLDPDRRLVGACPRGPLELPPMGNHWYVVPRVGFPDPETFNASYALLDGWLQALAEETGVPPERTLLGGFSQGTVMAWALGVGPGRPRPAGVLAMSGFIPTVPGFELSWPNAKGLPIFIYHGSADPIISVDFAHDARDRAKTAGADVLYRETDVPHMVDPRIVPGLIEWVAKRFP